MVVITFIEFGSHPVLLSLISLPVLGPDLQNILG